MAFRDTVRNKDLIHSLEYTLSIFEADSSGQFKRTGKNPYIYAHPYIFSSEIFFDKYDINVSKKGQFSLSLEWRDINDVYTFRKRDNGRWYVIAWQHGERYEKKNGEMDVHVVKRTYPKTLGVIPFNQFNPHPND